MTPLAERLEAMARRSKRTFFAMTPARRALALGLTVLVAVLGLGVIVAAPLLARPGAWLALLLVLALLATLLPMHRLVRRLNEDIIHMTLESLREVDDLALEFDPGVDELSALVEGYERRLAALTWRHRYLLDLFLRGGIGFVGVMAVALLWVEQPWLLLLGYGTTIGILLANIRFFIVMDEKDDLDHALLLARSLLERATQAQQEAAP